jgi:zinc D-Ala-D-Ala dipeptidase
MLNIKTSLIAILPALVFISACGNIFNGNSNNPNPHDLDLIQTAQAYKQQVMSNPNNRMIDLEHYIQGIQLDIRYATENNFTGKVIYTAPRAYLRQPVAGALKQVQDSLQYHNLGLIVYDAYRPYAATLLFYEVYPDTDFVADPKYGSRHNRGCAVDVSLADLDTGREIPMPTVFDDFSECAHPEYTALPDTVIKNRLFLSGIMAHFGFKQFPTEWWHFDYQGWEAYDIMDLTFEDLEAL